MRHSQGVMCPQLLILQQCQEIVCSWETSHPSHCILLCWSREPLQEQSPRLSTEIRPCRLVIVPVQNGHELGPEQDQKLIFQLLPGRLASPHPPNESGNNQKETTTKILSIPCSSSSQAPSPAWCQPQQTLAGLGMEWLPQQGL